MRPGMEVAGTVRKQESPKVSRDSHRIRKPPLPLPQVQYRPPIIIHTYSPKVIHTEPDDFMSLVQKLTGSSDTRLRLKKSPRSKTKDIKKSSATNAAENSHSAAVANLVRQGSGSSAVTTNCGSPAVSEDCVVSDCHNETPAMKQSNSPRSPFDASFEFDNVSESMFSHFDAAAAGSAFSQQVKAEPTFSFHDSNNPFSFFADSFMPPASSRAGPTHSPVPPLPRSHHEMGAPLGIMDQMPLSFLSPDLPPAAWSQSFLDCLSAPAPSYQAPFPRQRFSGYAAPSTPESSTMVALENIQAFMLT